MNHVSMTNADSGSSWEGINIAGSKDTSILVTFENETNSSILSSRKLKNLCFDTLYQGGPVFTVIVVKRH